MHEVEAIRSLLPLLQRYRWAIPVVVSLGLLSSRLEGFGISLLIPFLQSFDPATQSASSNLLIGFLNRLFGQFFIPQRLTLEDVLMKGPSPAYIFIPLY